MDNYSDQVADFEQALKNASSKQALYYASDKKVISSEYKIGDVILSVSKQIKAFHKADCVKKLPQQMKKIQTRGKSELLPLNLWSNRTSKQEIKFETQCVSDTQLMNVAEDAEAQENKTGITQEFETTFCQKQSNLANYALELANSDQYSRELSTNKNNSDLVGQNEDDVIEQERSLNVNDTEIFEALGEDMEKSPILNEMQPIVKKTTPPPSTTPSPLVCQLECFEKFEALAVPIIEENSDIQVAKKLINSQIVNNELFIDTHFDPFLKKRKREKSPVFVIKVIKRNTNIVIPPCSNKLQKTHQDCIEDEILFSSDEENEDLLKDAEDLPLTCALETSFYNHTGVLDTTMYVGFQTASNKSIQINSDSFVEAKSILNENVEFTDLVNVFTKDYKSCENLNVISIDSAGKSVTEMTENIQLDKEQLINDSRIFDISEEALLERKDVLQDIQTNHCDVTSRHGSDKSLKRQFEECNMIRSKREKNTETLSMNQPDIKKDEKPSFDELQIELKDGLIKINDDNILQEFETKLIQQENIKKNDTYSKPTQNTPERNRTVQNFKGFQTASFKPIYISEKAIESTKKIFENIENELDTSQEPKLPGSSTASNKNIAAPAKLLTNQTMFSDLVNYPLEVNSVQMKTFKVNRDQEVKISDKAFLKTKIMFQDIIDSNFDENNIKNNMYTLNKVSHDHQLFNDVSNIDVCKETSSRREKAFKDIDTTVDVENSKSKSNKVYKPGIAVLEGFKTANGKPVAVSDKSLAKYKYIFQDINTSQVDTINENFGTKHDTNETKGTPKSIESEPNSSTEIKTQQSISNFHFRTASNKPVKISDESIAASQNVLNSDCENLKPNVCSFKGFHTASNKDIKISKEKLAMGFKIFDGIDLNENEKLSKQESSKINKKICESTACDITENLNRNEISVEGSEKTFVGFQTASNKKVNISKEALDKCKKIFDDMALDIENDPYKNNIDSFKSISNTKTAMETKFQFHTANNIPVSVNEEAIVASQVLFNRDKATFSEKSDKTTRKLVGFQTANNKTIEISKETLANARKMFDDIDNNLENRYSIKPKSQDVQLQHEQADHKTVDVSEEAIVDSQKPLNNLVTDANLYNGFQTASNKKVKISKEALVRTMKVFDDIDFNSGVVKDCTDLEDDSKKPMSSFAFKSANNNNIGVSEYGLEMSRKKFQSEEHTREDFREENVYLTKIFDTQVINNFEETLYTEDFLKERTPDKCKRSGSPILSCPKAKKRRYEAPASVEKIKVPEIDSYKNENKNAFVFDQNYKTNKMLKLKDLNEHEQKYLTDNIYTRKFNLNFENILEFEFKEERNEVTDATWNTDNIKRKFLDSINKKIIASGWIENHMKLIIWKLMSYEIKYPNIFHRVCSVKNVMEQLKYRYDRELYNVQRPAFRKILERDDVPSKAMVVCVAGVYVDGTYVSSVTNLTDTIELLLTDGWYCIKACIDKLIAKYVYDGKITVGTKLFIHGADLVNCEQGIAPWEDTSSVRLKIFGNSTRRARWDARLGYHGNAAILTQLSSVRPEGGKVSKMRVFVTRVYPTLYVEKFDDGSTVTRSEKLENLHQMKYESDRQMLLEKVYEEVEKEFCDQESQDSEGIDVERKLDSGSQIAKLMKKHRDPAEFRASLTESQLQLLQEYTLKHKDKQIEQVQRRVREKIRNSSLGDTRNVVPLMKIRVASVEKDFKITKGMISIWRPNEAIQETITEGKWIDVYNVVPTAVRYSEIQLSASRNSIFQNAKIKKSKSIEAITDSLKRQCYHIQNVARNVKLTTDYNEIDTVGIIFLIEPSNNEFEISRQLFQNVFLADENKNIICVNFWGGIKKFGFGTLLETGQIIACVNLQKRSGNTIKSIPQFRATEFSYFTKTPKYDCMRKIVEELIKAFSGLDKRKFQEDCIAIKKNFTIFRYNNCDVSPYRMNNSDYNISKNKMFIDSPLARDANLNLSGLDFESTFKQRDTQDLLPQEMIRKKKVNEKIAKLKIYGEPPPLSPINIINRSKNATNAFKSPLTTRNDVNGASGENTTANTQTKDKENLDSSPVLPLRKYTKRPSVNPVKLNFNNVSENGVDPFADEFDTSPPLSLD